MFGRVTPHQKRAMVRALQAQGHVVAMTGDGVNDVLALKDADMGIAMGAGSSATRAVAQLVLLDNKFATLPRVLAEGRRIINNIERVANLFITKATYAVLLTVLVGLVRITVPVPAPPADPDRHVLDRPARLLPRPRRRTRPWSGPASCSACPAVLDSGRRRRRARWPIAVYEITRRMDVVTLAEARTAATVTLLSAGLVVLIVVSRPLQLWKVALSLSMAGLYVSVLAIDFLRDYFQLDLPPSDAWLVIGVGATVAVVRCVAGPRHRRTLRSPTTDDNVMLIRDEHHVVAPSTGIEPVACRLGGDRSIQLSYEGEGRGRRERWENTHPRRQQHPIVDGGSRIQAALQARTDRFTPTVGETRRPERLTDWTRPNRDQPATSAASASPISRRASAAIGANSSRLVIETISPGSSAST